MQVKIHQAIFGYDGGHQLLAASLRLSTETRHFLAGTTDLSGSAPSSGFDQTCSGMPLPGTEFYVLFSTWLAPEMPRPGCVWSHALLIEFADLAQLADLGELRRCFRRPKRADEEWPLEPIYFSPRVKRKNIPQNSMLDGKFVLAALYGSPGSPVLIEASNVEIFSNLVFAIWSQQWPRLRRGFRFSTGSFGDRGRKGVPFDLQIIPKGSRRTWRQLSDAKSAQLALEIESSRNPILLQYDWMKIALDDLIVPDGEGFRSFLSKFGLDVVNPREAFSPLAAAFLVLQCQPFRDWTERLRRIGQLFPSRIDAQRLKSSMIDPELEHEDNSILERLWDTTTFLLTAPEASAFEISSVNSSKFLVRLWGQKKEELISMLARLVRRPESYEATSFVDALAQILKPRDLYFISDRCPELLGIIISHHPTLACDSEVWRLPGYLQSTVYDALVRLPLTQEEWAKIEGAMLVTATDFNVRDVVERAGSSAMQGAFHWLGSDVSTQYLPSQIWREALAHSAKKYLAENADISPSALALCAWFVPAEAARQTLDASRQDVQLLARESLESLPPPLRLPTAFLLMTLGLRATNEEGLSLILRSFYQVHDALAELNFSAESWSLLSSELPYLSWWEWDRCKKLKIAVHKWLIEHVKSIDPLVKAADTSQHRRLSESIGDAEEDSDHFLD